MQRTKQDVKMFFLRGGTVHWLNQPCYKHSFQMRYLFLKKTEHIRILQMNIWKIIYLKWGEKYEFMIDHRSYIPNWSICEIKAWKKFRAERDSPDFLKVFLIFFFVLRDRARYHSLSFTRGRLGASLGILENPWSLRYRCSVLPAELSRHLGAGISEYCIVL